MDGCFSEKDFPGYSSDARFFGDDPPLDDYSYYTGKNTPGRPGFPCFWGDD